MTFAPTVVLIDGDDFVPSLANTLGYTVVAASGTTLIDTVHTLAGRCANIVAVSAWPWPAHHAQHHALSQTVAAYRGVVSWHQLPALARALADVVKGAIAHDAHVLFTAPDPGPDAPPDTLMFLPQLAEQVSALAQPHGRSIAWQGATRQPSTVQALDALIDAHNVARVVECPVVPNVTADPLLRAHAAARNVTFTATDLGVATRIGMLAEVVDTVVNAEWAQATGDNDDTE
jgi:hypothetical protein